MAVGDSVGPSRPKRSVPQSSQHLCAFQASMPTMASPSPCLVTWAGVTWAWALGYRGSHTDLKDGVWDSVFSAW